MLKDELMSCCTFIGGKPVVTPKVRNFGRHVAIDLYYQGRRVAWVLDTTCNASDCYELFVEGVDDQVAYTKNLGVIATFVSSLQQTGDITTAICDAESAEDMYYDMLG